MQEHLNKLITNKKYQKHSSLFRNAFLLLVLFQWGLISKAQQDTFDLKRDFRYEMSETTEKIEVDGKLDETTWQSSKIGTDFWQKVPYYKKGADPKTEIKLTYDQDFLYVGAVCYQETRPFIRSLERDNFWDNDGIAVILDPMNTRANAVLFGLSGVQGVQWDASRAATGDVNPQWSNKWFGETHIAEGYWSAEFAIPLRILRYTQNNDEWGLNFVRGIQSLNQFHNWTAVPEGFWPPNPAFAGTLKWDKAPERKTGNYNLIPYVSSSVSKNVDEPTDYSYNAGLDAKVAVSSSLNLDMTFNPDFSNAEADQLVTNLTRFSIFLPERRNFFLENANIFGGFGNGAFRPFFSRRIGLDEDLSPVPILYGMRLTGNLAQRTSIGVMNVHSLSSENSISQNQSAIALNQQFGQSFIQGLLVNRQGYDGTDKVGGDYGRNVALEGFYSNDNNTFNVFGMAHRSLKEGYSDAQDVYGFGSRFRNANWNMLTDFNFVGENFFTDLGYTVRIENYDAERDTTVRIGYNSNYNFISYRHRPKEGNIATHDIFLENLNVFNTDWSFNESNFDFGYGMSLRNTSEWKLRMNYSRFDLLFPFSFTDDSEPLPSTIYNNASFSVGYESDERKDISWELEGRTGSFYNGRLTSIEASVKYRVRPWGNFDIGYQWNDIAFPDPYGKTRIAALLSKVEIGFSKNLLWTTLFQFVDQSDFIGLNTRLQWRFSPMSDVFLVYVDNYDVIRGMSSPSSLTSNNRALILKVNYWY